MMRVVSRRNQCFIHLSILNLRSHSSDQILLDSLLTAVSVMTMYAGVFTAVQSAGPFPGGLSLSTTKMLLVLSVFYRHFKI